MAGVQREGSLLCSCSEFKETEMQRSYGLWTWEEQTKKALTVLRLCVTDKNWQNENCQWFKKKWESSFSSCHSCPLSSLLFQVLTYISCTLCDSCLLSELRNYLSVFILQLMFSFTSCAAEVSLDWKQSFISHLPHRFKCNNTVVIMTQTQLLT